MKYFGQIGFSLTREEANNPGVWTEHCEERDYYGDIIRNARRNENGEKIIDDVTINNRFSILADEFMHDNLGRMRYLVFHNQKWKITDVEIQYPRLVISIGGLYHE